MVSQVIGMVAIIVAIALSIAIHEFGHLIPAKRFGVRVPDYAIGFGPSLLSRRIGETKYSWRLIPLGGYIQMIGMYPPRPATEAQGRFAQLADEARRDSMAQVLPSDTGRTFYEKTVLQRITIMLGGPFMNFFLAALLFGVAFVGIGFPTATTTIDSVSPCRVSEANPRGATSADGSCVGGRSPAAIAGITAGMRVTAINGQKVPDWQALDDALVAAAKKGTAGTVEAVTPDGVTRTFPIDFQVLTVKLRDANGNPTGETTQRAIMGVLVALGRERLSPTVIPGIMWNTTVGSAQLMLQFPNKIYELAQTMLNDGKRDPNGPVSVLGATRVGGDIAASKAGFADKALSLVTLAAALNLFLFLFNLLPLLPLDGGHVAAAVWEVVRDGLRRLRGRAAAGPVDTARLLPLTYAVSVLLIAVGSLVIAADIFKPISLAG